jgi:hypothetical protein
VKSSNPRVGSNPIEEKIGKKTKFNFKKNQIFKDKIKKDTKKQSKKT